MSAYQMRPAVRPKRLLLSTDRSEFSEGAIKAAISLAKTYGSKLHIISVAEVPEIISRYPPAAEKLIGDTRRHLDSLKERAEKEGVLCETILAQGQEPYQYIVREGAKNNVDMIIIGRRGRSSLERVLMGNVAGMVIGHSKRDVLVVPEDATLGWEHILLATDGSKYSEVATDRAIELV
jgi:nucleotide-binding universal stress UspA family protein